jgi:hypothetical protein
MTRAGVPTPLDLGPDPEPLNSERYEALLAHRQPRFVPAHRRRVAPHPLAVVPADWEPRVPAARL